MKNRVLGLSMLLFGASLLMGATAPPAASPAKPPAAAPAAAGPAAKNMKEYAKTPQASKRKEKYKVKAANTYDLKPVSYHKGPKLHLTLATKTPETFPGGSKKGVNKKDGKTTKSSTNGEDCVTTQVTLSAQSDSFLNNDYTGTVTNIFPGACYTLPHLTDGSWKEQEGTRNPIYITTNNPNTKGPATITVKDPNKATVNSGIAKIFEGYPHTTANLATVWQVTETMNAAAYDLAIGGSVSGFGADVSDKFDTSSSSKHVYLTIDATKALFVLSTIPPDNGFFTDSKVEATPQLAFISDVAYGIRVLANADLEFNSANDANHFKASYSGFGVGGSLTIDSSASSKNYKATVNAYIIGGPGNLGVAYDLKGLKSVIEKALDGATFQNARPISYTAMDMAGDIVGNYGFTEFEERTCTTNPKIENVQVSFLSGRDGKNGDTNLNVYLYLRNYPNSSHNDDMVGAIYGYQSRGHSSSFGGGQTSYVPLTPGSGSYGGPLITRDEMVKANGGHFRIHIYPNGNDTWNINGVTATLFFSDKTTQVIRFNKPFTISQDVTTYDLMFDGTFTAQ